MKITKEFCLGLGSAVFGAVIGIGSYLYLFTGDDPPHWEKIEVSGYGMRSPKIQYYLVVNDPNRPYINCPRWVRDSIAFNIENLKHPKAYWVLVSPKTWYHSEPYAWDTEPALEPAMKK